MSDDLKPAGDSDAESKAQSGLSAEEMKQRKKRSLAIALVLGVFIVLIFAVTVLRLGGSVAERSF